jgi:hypothetical protein
LSKGILYFADLNLKWLYFLMFPTRLGSAKTMIVLVWIMKSYKKLRTMRKKYSTNGQESTVPETKKSSGHITQLLGYQSYKSYCKSEGEGMKKEF